jgi:hypothetical protein
VCAGVAGLWSGSSAAVSGGASVLSSLHPLAEQKLVDAPSEPDPLVDVTVSKREQ